MKDIKFKLNKRLPKWLIAVICVAVCAVTVAVGFIAVRNGVEKNEEKDTGYSFSTKGFENVEKIQSLNEEMRGYYQTVMESESMINYTNSKREVDDLIQKISKILSASVEGIDPDSVDVTESCTGSCSSCSGCGG